MALMKEQEDEIKKIREQNLKNEREAQNGMDIGVGLVTLMCVLPYHCPRPFAALTLRTALKLWRYHTYLGFSIPTLLVLLQVILLPFSLTPRRMGLLASALESNHVYLPAVQLCIVLGQIYNLTSKMNWGVYDIAQVSLPLVVALAVEVQRRSERDVKRQMAAWEKTKYKNKGA